MDSAFLAELLRKYPAAMTPGGSIVTCVARLSFPSLDKPRKIEGAPGEPKFSASFLFPAGADLALLKSEFQRLAAERWPNGMPAKMNLALKKQDDKADKYDGYTAGCYYLTASSLRRPGMVDARNNPIGDPERFYGGCWVRASVRLFAYDKAGNRGVGAGLNNIQWIADDASFGGATRAEDDFTAIDGTPADTSAPAAPKPNGSAAPASQSLF